MSNILYPRVEFTVNANRRRTVATAESNATTLLAPFYCNQGPTNQLVAIDRMSDLISEMNSPIQISRKDKYYLSVNG